MDDHWTKDGVYRLVQDNDIPKHVFWVQHGFLPIYRLNLKHPEDFFKLVIAFERDAREP